MKIVLRSTEHAKRLAKALQQSLPGTKLATAQEWIARVLGYSDFHDLQRFTAGNRAPSLPDGACEIEIAEQRREFQARALAACAGIASEQATSIIETLQPSGTRYQLALDNEGSHPDPVPRMPKAKRGAASRAGKHAATELSSVLSAMHAIKRPRPYEIELLSLRDVSGIWYVDTISKRTWLQAIAEEPYSIGGYFRAALGSWRQAVVSSSSDVDLKDVYGAALRILRSTISVAHANDMTDVVDSLVEDADRLMCVAAGDGYLPGVDLVADTLLKTKASWLMLPSHEAERGGLTIRGNLILWQTAVLARQGRFSDAKKKLAEIVKEDGWEPDLEVIRTAIDAGIAHWHQKAFFKEVDKNAGAGLGFLIDSFVDGLGSAGGSSSKLVVMGEDISDARTAQIALTVSGSPGLLSQFDEYLLMLSSTELED